MKDLLVLFTFFFSFNLAFCQLGTEIPSIMFPNSNGTNTDIKELTSKESGYSIVFIGGLSGYGIRQMMEITSVYDSYKSLYNIKVIYIFIGADPVSSFNRRIDNERQWRKEFIALFDDKWRDRKSSCFLIPGYKGTYPMTYVVDSENLIQIIIDGYRSDKLTEYFRNIKQE